MDINEFRQHMFSFWEEADKDAVSRKDSYLALEQMFALYKRFDDREKLMANQILKEWALSDSEKIRFDALAIISEFHIVSASPALQELAVRLATTKTPGAPYELQKVNRLIDDLSRQRKDSRV